MLSRRHRHLATRPLALRGAALLTGLLLMSGPASAQPTPEIIGPSGTQATAPDLEAILGASTDFILFEGLPRRGFAREDRSAQDERERTDIGIFTIGDEAFYAPPLAVSDAERAALNRLVRAPVTTAAWRGMKLCGGFHADFLLRWPAGPSRSQVDVMPCFGCREMRILNGDTELMADLSDFGYARLRTLLDPLRQHGPVRPRRDEALLWPDRDAGGDLPSWDTWMEDTGAFDLPPLNLEDAERPGIDEQAIDSLFDWDALLNDENGK